MPKVIVKVVDAQTGAPLSKGITVSVGQDKIFEGYKEQFRAQPNGQGIVDYEASSLTKYRIQAWGLGYKKNEDLVDTGLNLIEAFGLQPIQITLPLQKELIPLPKFDPSHYFRDVGLAQTMPVVIIIVAGAAALIAVAYLASRVPNLTT